MAMSPEKYWLEDYLPFEMAPFWVIFVSFRGCTFECETNQLQILETSPLYPSTLFLYHSCIIAQYQISPKVMYTGNPVFLLQPKNPTIFATCYTSSSQLSR